MRTALQSRVADDVLNQLKLDFKSRSEKLCSALSTEKRIEIVNRPLGGYFLWIKFPDSVDCKKFLEFCEGRVRFMPGVRCNIVETGIEGENHDELFTSYARLCFADLDTELLEAGAAELIGCMEEYMLTLES